mmetsp:Transcript_49631/g.121143  ORF Transcript_49631/g.121143 Transcript_49631/m.121143 type:complete len:239 (-) Transcript_49631:1739-2455(-)
MQGGVAVVVLCVSVRLELEQLVHHVGVAREGREVEHREAPLVAPLKVEPKVLLLPCVQAVADHLLVRVAHGPDELLEDALLVVVAQLLPHVVTPVLGHVVGQRNGILGLQIPDPAPKHGGHPEHALEARLGLVHPARALTQQAVRLLLLLRKRQLNLIKILGLDERVGPRLAKEEREGVGHEPHDGEFQADAEIALLVVALADHYPSQHLPVGPREQREDDGECEERVEREGHKHQRR